MSDIIPFEVLLGKTLVKVEGAFSGSKSVMFQTQFGERYHMYHDQDCCEKVDLNDVIGDVEDIIGSQLVVAKEVSSGRETTEDGTQTWTFYELSTNKGTVHMRWYGASNGYYSESVDLYYEGREE